jgi:hypoxanthine phosphoribosyltransferase
VSRRGGGGDRGGPDEGQRQSECGRSHNRFIARHRPGVTTGRGSRAIPPAQQGRNPARASAHIESGLVEGDDAIGEILVPAEDLRRRVRELAAEVSRDYAGKDLILVGVLKGAVLFLSDLMRHLDIPCEVDFMAVASYGSATKSSGVVRILKDLDAAIEDREVLIVEDIVDSGLTLQYLLRNLEGRNPRSLEVCALLIKPERQKVDLRTKYVGFEIPNKFVIGYGLDHAERYRNLPYVAALKE